MIDTIFKEKPEATVEEMRNFAQYVGEQTGIDVFAVSRKRHIVVLRQVLMAMFKEKTSNTITMIASVFGKNHATLLHSIKQWELARNLSDNYSITMQNYWNEFEPKLSAFLVSGENVTTSNKEKVISLTRKLSEKQRDLISLKSQNTHLNELNDSYVDEIGELKKRSAAWERRCLIAENRLSLLSPKEMEELREIEKLKRAAVA